MSLINLNNAFDSDSYRSTSFILFLTCIMVIFITVYLDSSLVKSLDVSKNR